MDVSIFAMGVTLREGDREYFYAALDRHFPHLKEQYQQIYGNAYAVSSPHSTELMSLFHGFCKQHGIESDIDRIFSYLQEFPQEEKQYSLFE